MMAKAKDWISGQARAWPNGRWLLVVLALALVACRGGANETARPTLETVATVPAPPTAALEEPATRAAAAPAIQAESADAASPATMAAAPTKTAEPVTNADPLPVDWTVASAAQQATYLQLSQADPPERDDLELARAYLGWDGAAATAPAGQSLTLGTVQTLQVLNHDHNTVQPVAAEILAVSEHAYFWFEAGPEVKRPSERDLARMAELFDFIYVETVAIFGPEDRPGIDGDDRLHLVHASPATLCDTGPDDGYRCGLAGYFSADDILPASIYPQSNAREMFVVNASYFGSDFYVTVLAHELRHMIEDNYDRGDIDWAVEGSAMLSEELVGFPGNGVARANIYLENPDQQLNRWTDDYPTPYYGQGYLFNRFLYDRLGHEAYRQFAASPATGLAAVDEVARTNGLDVSGEGLWLDFLVAQAIHDNRARPERYRFGVEGLETAAMTEVENLPASFNELVHQFGADYYLLSGDETVTLDFQGSELASVLDAAPAEGQFMWLANRANYSHMRLTRPVDLRDVSQATLQYSVYHDIEQGYDFAYLFVSLDGGRTWQPLAAEGTQGLDPADDPSNSALAPRFYTGRSETWVRESADLSPYAGQEILIRFAYVTDPILTFGGLAIDDIAIPEIGFADGAESEEHGWTAEGFARVTAAMPQPWRLQLITFDDGVPQVERLVLDEGAGLSWQVDLAASDGRAILVVAAAAPMTLEQAAYTLVVRPPEP